MTEQQAARVKQPVKDFRAMKSVRGRTLLERLEEKVVKRDGCWSWLASFNAKGYGQLLVEGRPQGAHRISYRLYVGEIPDGMFVLHKCDNPECTNPERLFIGTNLDNMRDCKSKGRLNNEAKASPGEKNGRAKITADDVIAIRKTASTAKSLADVARQYGVNPTVVQRIMKGKSWKHL